MYPNFTKDKTEDAERILKSNQKHHPPLSTLTTILTVLGMEPGASHMLGKCSTTKIQAQPSH